MTSGHDDYIHGYDAREGARLQAQAWSVLDLLHADTQFAPGARVLEVGCGTGAQTTTLARNNPDVHIVAFDRSEWSAHRDRRADLVRCAELWLCGSESSQPLLQATVRHDAWHLSPAVHGTKVSSEHGLTEAL